MMLARPEVGCASVVRIRIVVVLPAPFGPSRPKIAPRCTSKLSRHRTHLWLRPTFERLNEIPHLDRSTHGVPY
jgi:hypothetical protein